MSRRKKDQPTESVTLRVVDDSRYIIGVPAVIGHEYETDPVTAFAHVESGLVEVVSGTPAEQEIVPYVKPGTADEEADGAAGGSDS